MIPIILGVLLRFWKLQNRKISKDNIPLTEFRAQFPQSRGNQIINLVFWGKLASDVANYYQPNDYILIEGYLSTIQAKILKKGSRITVFKSFYICFRLINCNQFFSQLLRLFDIIFL